MVFGQQPQPPKDDEPIEELKGSWIEELGSNWTYAGWCLFLMTFVLPRIVAPPPGPILFAVFGLLTLV